MSVPFGEQGGALRGVIDLVCGRLPRFVFGGPVGALVPVFHFHDETRADLEPKLQYLASNGYRTVTADDVARFVKGGPLPERAVAEGGQKIPWWNIFALLFGLARELSNEAAMERAEKAALTSRFLARKMQEYEALREEIATLTAEHRLSGSNLHPNVLPEASAAKR